MAATITATGVWTLPGALSDYVGGSGVQIGPSGGGAFDSRGATQAGTGGFPEFWQFIALMAAGMTAAYTAAGTPNTVTTLEAMDILRLQLADARRQPSMGERAYAP